MHHVMQKFIKRIYKMSELKEEKEIITKCVIDDEIQTYDMCSKSRDIEIRNYKNAYEYIGYGKIYEIDGKKYNSNEGMHFWKIKI